jgi:hypothetical protein
VVPALARSVQPPLGDGVSLRGAVCVYPGKKRDQSSRSESRGDVRRSDEATLTANEEGCAEQLARFFQGVSAVRVPVQVAALRGGGTQLREATVVEFAGREHAIFVSSLPLEFDDVVRLENDRKGSAAEAAVIAVQYHEGRKAVAVRFLRGRCDWVTQP